MVDKSDKYVYGALATMAILGVALVAKQKMKPVEPPEEKDVGAIKIEVYDLYGNKVPENSPLNFVEGETYNIIVTVTNLTTKAGMPWPTNLRLKLYAQNNDWTEPDFPTEPYHVVLLSSDELHYFEGAQQQIFTYQITIPTLASGAYGYQDIGYTLSGFIKAWLEAPTGLLLAEGHKDFTVAPLNHGTIMSCRAIVDGGLYDLNEGMLVEWWDKYLQAVCTWRNDSAIAMTGRVEIYRTVPSGETYQCSIYSGQDQTISPGATADVVAVAFKLGAEGRYTFTFYLKTLDGRILDSRTVGIDVIAPIDYGGKLDW